MAAGPVSYGQQYTIEAGARTNTVFPAASVYISDLQVFAFHLYDGASIKPMQYDVSSDGGQTFPVMRATTFSPIGNDDVFAAGISVSPTGGVRIVLLLNAPQCIAYSDNILTLPTTSTWTQVTPPGSTAAPVGLGVAGLNIVAGLQAGGSALKLAYSLDGGTTFTASATMPAETIVNPGGFQLFASPASGVWCFINPASGKIYRSTDSGANWGASVKTVAAGNAACPDVSAIFAVTATRLVACHKGQVVTSDNAGLTWTDRQNLTLNPPSTTAVNQGAICGFANFGPLSGSDVLGAVTLYPHEFNAATTRGAMWRSLDFGTTWTLVDCVGGSNRAGANFQLTGFVARAGRAVMDMRDGNGPIRTSWFNPNPAATGSIPATCGATIVADPCPEPEEA